MADLCPCGKPMDHTEFCYEFRGSLYPARSLTPSADVPACRDEDPAWSASLAACYPDSPEYVHPEESDDGL